MLKKIYYIYDAKIKNIQDRTTGIRNLASNTTLNAKINEFRKEILSITNLDATTAFNTKINEVKNKIPNNTNLATITALTVAENKIPYLSNLVKKTDCNTKFCEFESKITPDHDRDK